MEDTKDFYQTSSIPPLNVNGDIYSDNTGKATILNDYFTEQSSLDDSNANYRILKELAKPLSFPLSDLFNASLI